MIIGIGTDLTAIKDIEYLLEHMKEGALERMFTKDELVASNKRSDRAACLAGRFAAKEAVFKAFGGTLHGTGFDLRKIETLSCEDGSPYVVINEELSKLMDASGVKTVHISISHEGRYAIAMAVAEG